MEKVNNIFTIDAEFADGSKCLTGNPGKSIPERLMVDSKAWSGMKTEGSGRTWAFILWAGAFAGCKNLLNKSGSSQAWALLH
jgi:hypothetical protein